MELRQRPEAPKSLTETLHGVGRWLREERVSRKLDSIMNRLGSPLEGNDGTKVSVGRRPIEGGLATTVTEPLPKGGFYHTVETVITHEERPHLARRQGFSVTTNYYGPDDAPGCPSVHHAYSSRSEQAQNPAGFHEVITVLNHALTVVDEAQQR